MLTPEREGTVKITRIIKSNKPLSYLHNRRYLNPIIPKGVCKEEKPLKSLLQEVGEYQLSLPFEQLPGEKLRTC